MDTGFKLFGRNPTLWIAVINAVIVTVGTIGFHWFTGQQAALAVVVVNALSAAVNAWTVRPISPAIFTYALSSILALLGAYGLTLPDATTASLSVLVVTVLALVTRGQVSPVETAVSNASLTPVVDAKPTP